MKALFKLLILLVLLLVAAAVVAPFVIPADSYKSEIIQRVHVATGRQMTIGGSLRFTLLPMPGVHMEKVTLANPKGYDAGNMIEVRSADVQVELMPLFSRKIQVKSLVLDQPVIDLEVNTAGVPNWRFTPADAVPEMPVRQSMNDVFVSSAEAAEPPAAGSAISVLSDLQLADVKISGGTLRYADHRTRNVTTLENANLHLAVPGFSAPFTIAGTAKLDGQEMKVDGKVNSPQTLLAGRDADINLTLASTPLHLAVNGNASLTALKMVVSIETPSLVMLSEWALGNRLAWKGKTPLAFSAKGNLSCTPANCVLDGANIKLDQLALAGKLGVAWVTKPIYIAADLKSDAIDITPYMAEEKGKAASLFVSDAWAEAPVGGWSTTPIDVSGLHSLNADVKLVTGKFTAHTFVAENVSLNAALKDGVLKTDIPNAKLYGGSGKGDLTLTSEAAEPSIDAHVTLTGVQAQQLLNELERFDKFSGKADFALHAGGRGASERDIISGLSGDGKLSVTDGVLKGVDLGNVAHAATSLLGGKNMSESSGATVFSQMTGSYTITHGIIHNADLIVTSPSFTMRGAGDISLPARYVRYRLTPALADASMPKGKSKSTATLGVPILAEGPFENVTFRPDAKHAISTALQNPDAARDAVKNTVKSFKDQMKNGNLQNLLNGLGR